jgi:spermidine synthase
VARQAERPAGPPVELVDRGDIPGGGQLLLMRCGDDYSIQFGRDELMGSRHHVSEQVLATHACSRLSGRDGHILVGGLGMGFTLGAALAAWTPASSFVVAELVPQVIAWAKGPLSHISGRHIGDPRVSLELVDVHDVIAAADGEFDAILLDVDNGPDGFIRPENDRLYCNWGLRAAYDALRADGVLAIWSAYSDPLFVERLESAGFDVDEVRLPAFPDGQPDGDDDWHSIWFASKPSPARQAIRAAP